MQKDCIPGKVLSVDVLSPFIILVSFPNNMFLCYAKANDLKKSDTVKPQATTDFSQSASQFSKY